MVANEATREPIQQACVIPVRKHDERIVRELRGFLDDDPVEAYQPAYTRSWGISLTGPQGETQVVNSTVAGIDEWCDHSAEIINLDRRAPYHRAPPRPTEVFEAGIRAAFVIFGNLQPIFLPSDHLKAPREPTGEAPDDALQAIGPSEYHGRTYTLLMQKYEGGTVSVIGINRDVVSTSLLILSQV